MLKGEYRILPDCDNHITHWVCQGLHEDEDWLGAHLTFGFALGGEMIGGLIFHQYQPHHSLWWTVYSTDKRWCNRRMLKAMFGLAFKVLDCRRINLLVSASNAASLNFVHKLGFQTEGLLRRFRDNGEDCYILGMLKSECKWL